MSAPSPPANAHHQPEPAVAQDDITPHPGHQSLPPTYKQANAANAAAAAASNQQQQQHQHPQFHQYGVVPLNALGDHPQPIDCPFCHRRTMTELQNKGSSMQILVGVILFWTCFCLTCLPCLAHWFEDVEYRCGGCKALVARRRHDGPLEVLVPQVAPGYSLYGPQYGPQYAPQPQPQPQQPPMKP